MSRRVPNVTRSSRAFMQRQISDWAGIVLSFVEKGNVQMKHVALSRSFFLHSGHNENRIGKVRSLVGSISDSIMSPRTIKVLAGLRG